LKRPSYTPSKVARQKAVQALKRRSAPRFSKVPKLTKFEVSQASIIFKEGLRVSILDKRTRCDGREYDQIRPLSAEIVCCREPTAARFFSGAERRRQCGLATSPPPMKPRNWTVPHRRRDQQAIHSALQFSS
jgi:hypothetical protein